MAMHVWLKRPTVDRAACLYRYFRAARELGAPPMVAQRMAVYLLEGDGQGIYPSSFTDRLARSKQGGWRAAYGKNAGHYADCFAAHLPFILPPLIATAAAGTGGDLSHLAPWPVIRDWYEEHGRLEAVQALEDLYDTTEVARTALPREIDQSVYTPCLAGDVPFDAIAYLRPKGRAYRKIQRGRTGHVLPDGTIVPGCLWMSEVTGTYTTTPRDLVVYQKETE